MCSFCFFFYLLGMPPKFEPHITNVDLIFVVVNADMVNYTKHILMTLKHNALSLSIDS